MHDHFCIPTAHKSLSPIIWGNKAAVYSLILCCPLWSTVKLTSTHKLWGCHHWEPHVDTEGSIQLSIITKIQHCLYAMHAAMPKHMKNNHLLTAHKSYPSNHLRKHHSCLWVYTAAPCDRAPSSIPLQQPNTGQVFIVCLVWTQAGDGYLLHQASTCLGHGTLTHNWTPVWMYDVCRSVCNSQNQWAVIKFRKYAFVDKSEVSFQETICLC